MGLNFNQIYAEHRKLIQGYLSKMVTDTALPDVLQEVWINIHRSLHQYRGDAKLTTWLCAITRTTAMMYYRHKSSRLATEELPEHYEDMMPIEPSQHDELRVKERQAAYERALGRLSPQGQEITRMHNRGLPADLMADIIDKPIGTVRSRMFYARQDLLEEMKSEPALESILPPPVD